MAAVKTTYIPTRQEPTYNIAGNPATKVKSLEHPDKSIVELAEVISTEGQFLQP